MIHAPYLSRYLLTPPRATRPGLVGEVVDDAAAAAAIVTLAGTPRDLAGDRARAGRRAYRPRRGGEEDR